MPNLNQVMLMGNITKDVELKETPSGKQVAKFTIAVNKKWKDASQQWQEKATFIPIVVWEKQAENCNKYLSKGDPVFIQGSISTSNWEDNDGKRHYKTEVVAQMIQFLKRKEKSADERADARPTGDGIVDKETHPDKPEEKKATPSEKPKAKDEEEEVPF